MTNKLAKLAGVKAKVAALPVSDDMMFKARDALHTITRAEEHRKDRELMKHVKKLAKTQVKAVCK
jgi:hypothetical protein